MMRFLITCEHATNAVPSAFRSRIDRAFAPLLKTHRGFDAGALSIAKFFARELKAPMFEGEVSRLVIDLNRSPENPTAFSELLTGLTAAEKKSFVSTYHQPFRKKSLAAAKAQLRLSSEGLVHLSMHSFTPIWDRKPRPTDIGFLFDPQRPGEVAFARAWMKNLKQSSTWTIHANRPYRGTGDGHTVKLRKQLPEKKYIGIEIEVNQKLIKTQTTTSIAKLLFKTMP